MRSRPTSAFSTDIEHALELVRLPGTMRDEVWSRLRARIFVATPPAIAMNVVRSRLDLSLSRLFAGN